MTHLFIYLFLLVCCAIGENREIISWNEIPMPLQSSFAGFLPPRDTQRWKAAIFQATNGDQILLQKVLNAISSLSYIISSGDHFRWAYHSADSVASLVGGKIEIHKLNKTLLTNSSIINAPIVLFGHKKFALPNFEGKPVGSIKLGIRKIIQNKISSLPKKIVAIGFLDQNVGWLSSYFTNRTVYKIDTSPMKSLMKSNGYLPTSSVNAFLKNVNLTMLAVSQHHNCSHPKVITLPLGILNNPDVIWNVMNRTFYNSSRKSNLLLSISSNWGFRPMILDCIMNNLGSSNFTIIKDRISSENYYDKISQSAGVIAISGFGADTYRLWETLLLGSMPVLERGFGLERTLYRLPVLFVDDYALLTLEMFMQAYLEALYRIDEWDYTRLTKKYWIDLIKEVARTQSIEKLLRNHPMAAEKENFTRPLIPFDCVKIGGCGPGTKQTPIKYCGVDASAIDSNYKWNWHSNKRQKPGKKIE